MKKLKNFFKDDLIHLIGIGGIGMSAIALLLKKLNFNIQGSNITKNSMVDQLIKNGIKISVPHRTSNLENVKYCIFSSAIKESNIELQYLKKKDDVLLMSRFSFLELISKDYFVISVSGMRGKTTITSMISEMFDFYQVSYTCLNGGIIQKYKSNFIYYKNASKLLLEIDESDGHFKKISSNIVIINNIEEEHLDNYKNIINIKDAFTKFVNSIKPSGYLIFCLDCKHSKSITKNTKKIISYGIYDINCNIRAININYFLNKTKYDIQININNKKKTINNIIIPTIGEYNIYNSLACISTCIVMNLDEKEIKNALKNFVLPLRRFTVRGNYLGAKVIDDYAHHPTKIKAIIKATRFILNKNNKLITICEPHKYSRIKNFLEQFVNSLLLSDFIIITQVCEAGEKYDQKYNSSTLVKNILIKHKSTPCKEIYTLTKLRQYLRKFVKPGDIILFCGAGSNITNWAQSICIK